jgi:hypothetical protein
LQNLYKLINLWLHSRTEKGKAIAHSLPTFPATLATHQSAAVIAECDSLQDSNASRTLEDEEKRSKASTPVKLMFQKL